MDFIGEYSIEDLNVCDGLVDFFNASDCKYTGKTISGTTGKINHNPKKRSSLDLDLLAEWYLEYPAIKNYIKQLHKCIELYKTDYPACDVNVGYWRILEDPKIQYYKPGEAYFSTHCERVGHHTPICYRHLVFMTYLNDVTDGGGTEFIHQKKITSAVKGKTVIWPADWTHIHRGVVSPTQEKYILTGWLSFTPEKNREN